MTRSIRILGVDPGLRRTGWGLIAIAGNDLSFIAAGTVKAPLDGELAMRLLALKGTRRSYRLTAEACFRLAVRADLEAKKREKRKSR